MNTPLTQIAHERWSISLKPGDVVVDATLGNGHDAVFLQKLISPMGVLYGFDLQAEALEQSRRRLAEDSSCEIRLFQRSHADLFDYIEPNHRGRLAAVVYNLGYLPGADKALTTERASTLQSLQQALRLLKPTGLLSVICYQGHDEGRRETNGVEEWASGLSNQGKVEWVNPPAEKRLPPRLLLFTKND